ncbi:hypothetical protein ACW4YW_15205 [Methylobacillus pratensis]
MILRLLTFLSIKSGRKLPWRLAWRKSAKLTTFGVDLFYTCMLICILIATLALNACASLEPIPPSDPPTKDDLDAARVMREMNGFHSGRIEQ